MKKVLGIGLVASCVLPGMVTVSHAQKVSERVYKLYEPAKFKETPYRLMKPVNFDPNKAYPLILSLHGASGKGNCNKKNLKEWNATLAGTELRNKYPCFVLAPQMDGSWRVNGKAAIPSAEDVKNAPKHWEKWAKRIAKHKPISNGHLSTSIELIESLKKQYKIDEKRIYVLGHSMGGFGTWSAIWHHPGYFAAAIPSAGGLPPWFDYTKLKDTPIWAFHSTDDEIVLGKYSKDLFEALKEAKGVMKYTELKGIGHRAQQHAFAYKGDKVSGFKTYYSSDRCDKTEKVWDWLFKQKLK